MEVGRISAVRILQAINGEIFTEDDLDMAEKAELQERN